MKKKIKFPYDYKTIPLKNGKGTATITGEPTPELMNAINALAEAAYKKVRREQSPEECDANTLNQGTEPMAQNITPEAEEKNT